jgi:threonyl-tRNA synthetase
MRDELASLLKFVLNLLKDFGLTDFYLELSTKDPKKFVGSDEIWETATRVLEEVALESQLELVPDIGGAAFYGPKISVQVRDAIGRTWQISTIQLDFNEPELFDLEYQASDGTRQRPVMIHRALFGSIERFFGILVEHYAGAFPAWLAPVQVRGVPVAEEFEPYVDRALNKLAAHGIRVELDQSEDRFGKKIRTAIKEKIPFTLIAGEQDKIASAVSLRLRDGQQLYGMPLEEAIEYIVSECQAVGSRK